MFLAVTKVEKRWRRNCRFGARARVYISATKAEDVVEQMINRRRRPYTEYRKQVMPKVLKELGYPADTKYRWSQRCGCDCGCSPGFILKEGWDEDIYVTVEERVNGAETWEQDQESE